MKKKKKRLKKSITWVLTIISLIISILEGLKILFS
jgi:hypothetical protein